MLPEQQLSTPKHSMISLFQSASGSLHIPSVLMVASWLAGSLVTGGFIFANLRVNRNDRLNAAAKEEQATKDAGIAASRMESTEQALESAREQLGKAQADAKDARDVAAKAEAASKPRRLTDEQKASLAESLKSIEPKPKIFMCAGVFDPESVAFGEDIEKSLIGAGFEVKFPKGFDDSSSLVVSPTGLHIVVKDPKLPNPTARKIQKCFDAAGIKLPGIHSEEEDFPADRIEIAVGPK